MQSHNRRQRRSRDAHHEAETLVARLAEAEEMLRGDSAGEVDALVVEGAGGDQIYTLHSAEEPYRNLVEQMQEGAVVLTSRGDILYSNARFAALVGEPLESVVGSHVGRFVHASGQARFETLLAAGSGAVPQQPDRTSGRGDDRSQSLAHHDRPSADGTP